MGLQGRCRKGCLGAAVAAALLALALPLGNAAASTGVRLKILTRSDAELLSTNHMDVRAYARDPRTVQFTTSFVPHGPSLTKPIERPLSGHGYQPVALPLSAAGREVLEACGVR